MQAAIALEVGAIAQIPSSIKTRPIPCKSQTIGATVEYAILQRHILLNPPFQGASIPITLAQHPSSKVRFLLVRGQIQEGQGCRSN